MQWIIALTLLACISCLNGQLTADTVNTRIEPIGDIRVLQTKPPPSTEPPYTREPPYTKEPPYTTEPPTREPPYTTKPPTREPPYTTEPPYVPPSPYPTEVYPYDPYEPYDPYDPYPFYFCDLNDDEYGRPYYGPYDEYRPPYQPIPSYPPPTEYPPPTRPPTYPPYYVRPLTTTALPPREAYDIDEKALARTKRQSLTLPSCLTSDECDDQKERCAGYGTRYDRCGRRCTCREGYLEDCCRVRKEWRSMTQVERCRYVRVIYIASTVQPWKSCYDELIRIHRVNFGAGIHNQNFFLPWHRWYILALENLLRQIDCRVTVPYWDWSLESLTWQNSIVWATQCGLGGDGVAANGNRVGTGPFRQGAWQLTPSASGTDLQRNFNGRVPDCASIAETQRLGVAQFNVWHAFISSTLHDSVHCRIGGTMCSVDSANAPEFFLHHGFIDKLWEDWQNKGPAFKHQPFYATNASPMPGAYGASPSRVYNLDNQPGCVKVCVEPSARPCRLNTTYTPTCPNNCYDYSPIKLAEIIPRPYPRVPQASYELFNTPYEIRRISDRYHQLFNDYDELYRVLESNGYGQDNSYRPTGGEVNFERYLYETNPNDPTPPPPPDVCRPYLPQYY